jgi:hypothetical protein
MGNINVSLKASDADLVKSGDAMVTAGGLLALGETVTTISTLGLTLGLCFVGMEELTRQRLITTTSEVASLITLALAARVFDLKWSGRY